jgi:outer membrane protein, heavy metal efflux system
MGTNRAGTAATPDSRICLIHHLTPHRRMRFLGIIHSLRRVCRNNIQGDSRFEKMAEGKKGGSNIPMKQGWLFTLTITVTLSFWAGALPGQENVSLDSLRLGANYLRWAPNGDGGTTAAPTNTTPAPIGNEPVAAAPEPVPLPQSEGMSLADWEALAEQNNPTLAQAAARVQALRAEWLQSGLYPNPRVGYQGSEINDEGQAGQQGAFVEQEYITAHKLQRAQDVASHAIQVAECAWTAQRQRVQNDVRRAYYDVLVAQRSVELTDHLVRIGQEGVRSTEELLKAKEVSRVDVLQARIEADSARILADKSRNRHISAWRNLVVVSGVPNLQPLPLVGDLQDGLAQFQWDTVVNCVLSNSPTLAESRSGVSRAEAALSRECAGRVPNVDFLAGVLYDNATRDTIAEVQVGVPLPVFNRNQGNIRKAQAELTASRAEVRRVELELQQQLAAAFEQYDNARSQVEKYASQILPNAQSSLDLVTAGYRQGEFNYITLLTSQRTFFQVNLAYVDAIRELRSAVVAIEGNLLANSLQQR